MNLHEAIKEVLKEHSSVLAADEICQQIKGRYTKRDGSDPDYSQILMMIKNYRDQFRVIV